MGRRLIAASWLVALATLAATPLAAPASQKPEPQFELQPQPQPAPPAGAPPIELPQGEPADLPAPTTPAADEFNTPARPQSPPAGAGAEADKLDTQTVPAQAPPAPAAAPAAGAPAGGIGESYILPGDKLSVGPQAVSVTVDVRAPKVMNLNKPSTLQIVVKNSGTTDAFDVVVRDTFPEALEFLESTPPPASPAPTLAWSLGTLPAGGERTIDVKVKAIKVASFEHSATVSMKTGGKSRTQIQEPLLKVEPQALTARVLKGKPARFKINVSNPGTGPATNIVVTVKLGQGLNHTTLGRDFHQTITRIEPNGTVSLDEFSVDTTLGGEQACIVSATSPDVVSNADNSNVQRTVNVVAPKLELKIVGPQKRPTDTLGNYTITLQNSGTAEARATQAWVAIPPGTLLASQPSDGGKYDKANRRITWAVDLLEPNASRTFTYQVKLGGVGAYSFAAEALAQGLARVSNLCTTDVTGIADVDFKVAGKHKVLDVGETTLFVIEMNNHGSKDATEVRVNAIVSGNLKVESATVSGTDEPAQNAPADGDQTLVKFPLINDLPSSASGTGKILVIEVKAVKPGQAVCRVQITHRDLDGAEIEHNAYTRVMANDASGGTGPAAEPAPAVGAAPANNRK
ncbi:hypothetical protein EP7_002853 [Isosphaeraceae bacterium EP7]